MKAQFPEARHGFTLIELLVVIAIIAILAGMVFPMAGTMRERGNQTACLGNLQNIGQALKLYRLDERAYPPALYGYVENVPDEPEKTDTTVHTFLYPHYVRNRRDFKCPDNLNRFDESKLAGPFQGAGNIPNAVPLKPVKNPATGKVTLEPITDNAIAYYLFDSYDGSVLPPNYRYQGTEMFPVSNGGINPPGYELHYRRDWVSIQNGWDPNSPNAGRELLNRNPEDKTFVTACTYHRSYDPTTGLVRPGANSMDMALFLDGHTEKRPSDEIGPLMSPRD